MGLLGGIDMVINPGQKLFEFFSEVDWCNKGARIWRIHLVRSDDTVCVDQLGRICTIGRHFMAATRDNDDVGGFSFVDLFDHRFTKPTYHFVWACYAIAWGIQQWDMANGPVKAV